MRTSQSLVWAAALALLAPTPILAKDSETPRPCTIKSPTTGSYFDLSSLSVVRPDGKHKASRGDREESWHARGYDHGSNFTINICAPVVEDLEKVQGLDTKELRNVSAFYQKGSTKYSIGSVNTDLVFRGRKLVLSYTGGSPCPAQGESATLRDARESIPLEATLQGRVNASDKSKDSAGKKHGAHDDDDQDEDKDGKGKDKDHGKSPGPSDNIRRKSTIISFLCDSNPNAPKAALSYVGTNDECTYMFEARSPAACGGASEARDPAGVGPAGVFGLIVLIAVAAYILGGIAYQRTVMHQRGWKQLPNYGTWAGIGNFIKDFFIIAFSSCSRWIPGRRGGYNQLPTRSDRSRFSRNEDENRLIDQLDEEWDD